MADEIDTSNRFGVWRASTGEISMDSHVGRDSLSVDDALNLAAWLVAVAVPAATSVSQMARFGSVIDVAERLMVTAARDPDASVAQIDNRIAFLDRFFRTLDAIER